MGKSKRPWFERRSHKRGRPRTFKYYLKFFKGTRKRRTGSNRKYTSTKQTISQNRQKSNSTYAGKPVQRRKRSDIFGWFIAIVGIAFWIFVIYMCIRQ